MARLQLLNTTSRSFGRQAMTVPRIVASLIRLFITTLLAVGLPPFLPAQQPAPPPQQPPSPPQQQVPAPSSRVGGVDPNTGNATQESNGGQAQTNPQSQETQSDDAGQFVFRKKVEEVVLHAVVVNGQNDLIANLDKSSFHVYEDSKPQEITSFYQEHVPVALGILIDNSGSMRPKRASVNQAALNLVRSSNSQDEVFVVNFGEQYYLDQDFTSDVAKLQTALEKVETRGSTALYDAIVASAAHMKQGAELQKRILLVVTDGGDNASQESLEEAVQQLQQKDGPVVYVIALLGNSRNAGSTTRALESLSQSTGGTAFFPTDVSQVDSITRSIASAIRSQYVIGYKSSSTATGHVYHTIQVDAFTPDRRKLRVRTRTGYYSDSGMDSSVPAK
jgi:Ca-activated chloride channel family protein